VNSARKFDMYSFKKISFKALISKRYAGLFFFFQAFLSGIFSNAYAQKSTEEKIKYYFSPLYSDSLLLFQDSSGDRGEDWRYQNIYNLRYGGLDAGLKYKKTETGMYITFRHRITSRYTYDRKKYDDYLNRGIAFFYIKNPEYSLDAGRLFHRTDREGFLFSGETDGIRGSLTPSILSGFRFSSVFLDLSREETLRSKKKGSDSVFTAASAEYENQIFHAGITGGYYRVFGRPNIPDYRFGTDPEAVLPTGQPGIYDTGIHYYMLNTSLEAKRVSASFTGIYLSGYQSDRAFWSATDLFLSREIKGWMGYTSLLYRMKLHQFSDDCSGFHPALCAIPVIDDGPVLEISGILTSRDKNSRDNNWTGFGSIRPAVSVMGGPASILLNGSFSTFTPFKHDQPGTLFYTGPIDEKEFRDNSDPSIPDYSSRMEMASVRAGFVLHKFSINMFASRALWGEVSGKEGVLLLSRKINTGKIDLSFFIGGAVADVIYVNKNPGIWIEHLEFETRKNYIRYVCGLFFQI